MINTPYVIIIRKLKRVINYSIEDIYAEKFFFEICLIWTLFVHTLQYTYKCTDKFGIIIQSEVLFY